jgi:hypothetical protein
MKDAKGQRLVVEEGARSALCLMPKHMDGDSHNHAEVEQLVFRIAILVDDLHLLDNRRLSRFSGSCSSEMPSTENTQDRPRHHGS